MKTELGNKLSRSFHKLGFQIKKHSPEILVVAGVTGVVASTVMACKATLKVNEVLDESKQNIDKIHEATEKGVTVAGEEYTADDAKKDLTITYVQTGVQLVKLYAPAVIIGGLALTSIISSHHIMRKRNVALAAAYATVDKSFKDYRGRVIDRFGKDLDMELRHNIKAKEVEEKIVDENGEEKTIKKTVKSMSDEPSEFAVFFDEYCLGWTKSPEANKLFLKMQQAQANERLQRQGYLMLNDVYEMLGIPKTKAGHVVGWIYDPKYGDCYVDFGIYDINDERKRAFVNGRERSILLDFNVDGNVWKLLND